MKAINIMIVEDDIGIREMTQNYLEQEGYRVFPAENGERALSLLNTAKPDLVLLDIEMPGMDGFAVCQEIRKKQTIPIIFLTVRRDTVDKVRCFELGGDDYVTKPFDFEELGARIKANIRRYYAFPQTKASILKYGDLEIHVHKYACYLKGRKIELSTKEMELLIHLARHPNQVWSQEQLYDHIWSIEATGSVDTVRVHISYLRRKLEDDPVDPKFIKTIHGFGYLFSG